MGERTGDDLILERMYAREQVLLGQADALDMKASYLLVVLVFLAQLSATFLSRSDLSCFGKAIQWLVCLLLVVSGIFLLLELRVKSFSGEDALGLEGWRDGVVAEAEGLKGYPVFQNPDAFLRNRLVRGFIDGSKARIAKSEEINEKKVRFLNRAYWLAFAAFVADVLYLITTRLSSGV